MPFLRQSLGTKRSKPKDEQRDCGFGQLGTVEVLITGSLSARLDIAAHLPTAWGDATMMQKGGCAKLCESKSAHQCSGE